MPRTPRPTAAPWARCLCADDATGDAFGETLAAIEARGGALRLRIDPPDLTALGWERVFAPIDGNWRPLAATAATPFSRYVVAQGWERTAPITERPLRRLTATEVELLTRSREA